MLYDRVTCILTDEVQKRSVLALYLESKSTKLMRQIIPGVGALHTGRPKIPCYGDRCFIRQVSRVPA